MGKEYMNTNYGIVKPCVCPHCGHNLNVAWDAENDTPNPGDLSICISCGGLSMFNEELSCVDVGVEVWDTLPEDLKVEVFQLQTRQAIVHALTKED